MDASPAATPAPAEGRHRGRLAKLQKKLAKLRPPRVSIQKAMAALERSAVQLWWQAPAAGLREQAQQAEADLLQFDPAVVAAYGAVRGCMQQAS